MIPGSSSRPTCPCALVLAHLDLSNLSDPDDSRSLDLPLRNLFFSQGLVRSSGDRSRSTISTS